MDTNLRKVGKWTDSRDEQARKLAEDLTEFVNVFGPDMKTFAETICSQHKTLQQSVMRLFIFTIEKMADVPVDERNQATVELAKQIREIADYHSLPLI